MDHLIAYANTENPEHAGACECLESPHGYSYVIVGQVGADFYATVSDSNARKWGWI